MRTEVARGRRLDIAFGRAASSLPPRDRAFLQELTYGVTRLQGRLDHLLEGRVHGGLDRLDVAILELLRLGTYELLYMDGVPAYATVSQTVDLAREEAGKAAGLVNAVLRGLGRAESPTDAFPPPDGDPLAHLTAWGSHPEWLVRRWLARWSPQQVQELVERANHPPGLFLAPLDVDPEAAVGALAAEGIEARAVGEGTRSVRLAGGSDPREALAAVTGVMQDPAASLVADYAAVTGGMKVADLCAAPGGKALALSRDAAYTLAADRSEVRMRMVKDNARRTGRRLGMVVADALHPPLRHADVVFLDVPCTGTGTLGRHPDGRWRLRPGSVVEMAALQRRILDAAAPVVPKGGLLVYATCSLEPEENEEQVMDFMARHPDFGVDATRGVPHRYLSPEGFLTVLPQDTGFDGAFAARLRRAA